MKSYFFLFAIALILFSCESKTSKIQQAQQEEFPTKTHEILKSFYTELKVFYVINGFCSEEDDISIGNLNFAKYFDPTDYKYFPKNDLTCQKLIKTKIYDEIWGIDTSYIGDLEGTIITDTAYTAYYRTDTDYHLWLKTNHQNFQPFLEEWYYVRTDLMSSASRFLFYQNLRKELNVNFADDILTNTIIMEFLLGHLMYVCNEEK